MRGIPLWIPSRWAKVVATTAVILSVGASITLFGGEHEETATTLDANAVKMLENGRWEDARAALTKMIDAQPDDRDTVAMAHLNRAYALEELGRFAEAIADTTAVIDLKPDDTNILAMAHLNRSYALGSLGRLEEVIADTTAVIDLKPDHRNTLAMAHLNRSFALRDLGRGEEAGPDLTAILELLPPTDRIHQLASELLEELGLSEAASVQIDGDNQPGARFS